MTLMPTVTTLFFDVGGVLLTNAWDSAARRKAVERFQLEPAEFQTRHEMLKTAFETGRLTLDGYLRKAVFHRPRPFPPEAFREFMLAQSQPHEEMLAFVRTLAATGRYQMFTLNNESRELHEYRVERYGLSGIFQGFLTSCYLGQVKPDESVFAAALGIAGCAAERAVFIDDRPLNVEPAVALGLRAIPYQNLDALVPALAEHGVVA
jgi:putative hydrolase of the HAD superfamily